MNKKFTVIPYHCMTREDSHSYKTLEIKPFYTCWHFLERNQCVKCKHTYSVLISHFHISQKNINRDKLTLT